MTDPFAANGIEDLRRRRGQKWSTYAGDVIPAWVADLDAPPCPQVAAAIDAVVARGDLTYPAEDTEAQLADAFARRMKARFDWSLGPADVLVFTDVVQAASLAITQCTQPGDGVILAVPAYPPFVAGVPELGRRLVPVSPDLESLEAAAADPANRAMLLVNPQNPTGHSLTEAELVEIADLCARHDLFVVCDEIWAEFVLDGGRHHPFAPIAERAGVPTFTVTSATKSHNIAGVRVAVGHTASPKIRDAIDSFPRVLRGEVSVIGAEATLCAWSGAADEWLDDLRATIGDRHRMLAALLGEHLPEISWSPPEATYVAWVDARPLDLPMEPYDFFLERARVALGEGATYGPGGEGRVRINVGTSVELLTEVVERMVTSVDLHRG